MEEKHRLNIAYCLKNPKYQYKPDGGDVILSSYATIPIGGFVGLFYRWRYKMGWHYKIAGDPQGSKIKFAILIIFLKLSVGIVTALPGFIYATILSIWIDEYSWPITLLFAWGMTNLINGFMFTCGLQNYLMQQALYTLGFKAKGKPNSYLISSMPHSQSEHKIISADSVVNRLMTDSFHSSTLSNSRDDNLMGSIRQSSDTLVIND